MAIARTANEAKVGDHLWIMPSEYSSRSRDQEPRTLEVVKVARRYLTVLSGRGTAIEFDRESGAVRMERGYSNGDTARGWYDREVKHWQKVAGEISDVFETWERGWRSGIDVEKVVSVARIMGVPGPPDFRTIPEDKT
jgi:hypothetical protein